MTLREKLLALRPNATVQAVTLSNGATVYIPRLSLLDALKLDKLRGDQGEVQAMTGMLAVMVRDEAGQPVFANADEAGDVFTSEDAAAIVNACMSFNALPTGEGESPNR